MDLLKELPCLYLAAAILWSVFQGVRGVVETRHNNKENGMALWQKIIVLDIHDFFFRFVCTMAGFFALYVSYFVLTKVPSLFELSSGTSVLIAFSFLIGIIGVGGQLHYVILMGKLPSSNPG